MHYFFKKISSQLTGIDQTNKVYSNDDQGMVYQKWKFYDPRGWGSDVRAWPYKSYSENAYANMSRSDKKLVLSLILR